MAVLYEEEEEEEGRQGTAWGGGGGMGHARTNGVMKMPCAVDISTSALGIIPREGEAAV
jgi:hypothetical protein